MEQLGLEAVEAAFEVNDIQPLVLECEGSLDVLGDCRVSQDSMIGCLRTVIATGQATATADFFDEFHHRLEEVGVEPQELVE